MAKAIVAPAPSRVLHAKSPKAYSSTRHLARMSSAYRGNDLVLELSPEKMRERIEPWVQKLACLLLSVGLDATKLFKILAPIPSFRKIGGKAAPNHLIPVVTTAARPQSKNEECEQYNGLFSAESTTVNKYLLRMELWV